MKTYILIGADGKQYESATPGTLGGQKRNKEYCRFDYKSVLCWTAKGYYVKHQVFFADEPTPLAEGYRTCATCMKERNAVWKKAQIIALSREGALELYRTFLKMHYVLFACDRA